MINVKLAGFCDSMFLATINSGIENEEDEAAFDLAESDTAAEACADASEQLRELANRFDALARDPKPCHVATHARINNELRLEDEPTSEDAHRGASAPPALRFSAPMKPNDKIGYDHVICETPFGPIIISWKGWKERPSYDIEEMPGGMSYGHLSLASAIKAANDIFYSRVAACSLPSIPAQGETL